VGIEVLKEKRTEILRLAAQYGLDRMTAETEKVYHEVVRAR